MYSPLSLLRFVISPVLGFSDWLLLRTAPFLALSPVGLLLAIIKDFKYVIQFKCQQQHHVENLVHIGLTINTPEGCGGIAF
jgi:hypothetical protein